LIGPVRSWLPARLTARTAYLRRDLGILAGLSALLHVVLVLVLFSGEPRLFLLNGTNETQEGIIGMFFHRSAMLAGVASPNLSLIGIANYLGLAAFLMLLCLWLTSSDKAAKWLGTPAWKRIHLANPYLFLLVVFHGTIYIHSIKGHPHTISDILWLAGAVLAVRAIFFIRTVRARQK
jgi:DMSO/TMAO reductase YedYZ heme-binding membrane subunit